ncbi:MAG: regulatory protein [Actinomycetota bacterium]|nr:regulatory protein [Actinomycetota bacterium]MEA2591042.1 regulatory protein [Actinomycetota bacterium]
MKEGVSLETDGGYGIVPGDLPEATDAAMRYLAPSARSCWEVRRHLVAKGFGEDVAAAAEARLLDLGILDDREFARNAVESAVLRRHEAPAKVQLALQAKGVARELVADALAEILMDEGNVDGAVAAGALRLPSLHGPPLAIRRKLGAYLARRGYEAEVIDEACSRLLGEFAADEADDQAARAGPRAP